MKILVFSAHPDDAELAIGGTITKFIENKDEVSIVYFNTGLNARGNVTNEDHEKMKGSIKKSCKILGVVNYEIENLPDNRFDSVDLLDIIKIIEKYLNKYNPDVIYTHSLSEINIDHKKIHDAVITACKPDSAPNIKKVFCFSVPEANMFNPDTSFKPNYYEILELKHIILKIRAFCCYTTELKDNNHPRSDYGILRIAEYYGLQIGHQYAEPLELLREIND